MNIFFEDEKCRYGLIDKRSFEFLGFLIGYLKTKVEYAKI